MPLDIPSTWAVLGNRQYRTAGEVIQIIPLLNLILFDQRSWIKLDEIY